MRHQAALPAALLLLAAAFCAAEQQQQHLQAEEHATLLAAAQADPAAGFEAWMAAHSKAYQPGSEEHARRYGAWLASLGVVASHAARNDAPGYSLGLGPFADWTDDEFRGAYLGKLPTISSAAAAAAGAGGALGASVDEAPLLRPLEPAGAPRPPAQVDWREAGIVGPVKDQHANGSKCGCCWAFATIATVEMINAQYTGEVVTLSEQQLIDCDTGGYDLGCEGGGFDTGVKYIARNGGIDTDVDYPYVAADGKCNAKKNARHVVTVDGIEELPRSNETNMALVVAQAPVVTAICCGPFITEWRLYTAGIFDPGDCIEPIDHALPVIGYGTTEAGEDFWVIKNSWGAHWGEQGFIKLPRNVSNKLGKFALAHKPGRVFKTHPNPGQAEEA